MVNKTFETNQKLKSLANCLFIADSSGIRIYYTEKKRKYELGNVQIGQNDIEIAPGSMKLEHHGSCSPYCTSTRFTHPFYLTRTFIHMHSLGKS